MLRKSWILLPRNVVHQCRSATAFAFSGWSMAFLVNLKLRPPNSSLRVLDAALQLLIKENKIAVQQLVLDLSCSLTFIVPFSESESHCNSCHVLL